MRRTTQHLQFALGQCVAAGSRLGQPRNEARRDRRVDRRLTSRCRAHRPHDLAALCRLQNIPSCAGVEQAIDVRVVVIGCQHEHADIRHAGTDLPRGFDTCDLRDRDVHDDDIGLERARQIDRLLPVGASPMTAMSSSSDNSSRMPLRTTLWSSAITTRIAIRACSCSLHSVSRFRYHSTLPAPAARAGFKCSMLIPVFVMTQAVDGGATDVLFKTNLFKSRRA